MELGCEGMGDFNTNSPYYPSRCYYPPGTPAPYTTTPAAVPPPRFRGSNLMCEKCIQRRKI